MNRKIFILLAIPMFFLLVSCGNGSQQDNPATQSDAPHTFAGYPVVYLTSDVSARGLFSAYEALEPEEDGTVGIKLSGTLSDSFSWSDLAAELIQTTGASIIESEEAETGLSDYDNTIILTHFEPHDMIGFFGTVAHMASASIQ